VLRFYLLSTHYRSNFNFNEEDLIASKKRLDKLYRLKKRLFGMKTVETKTDFQARLLDALSDDLNVSAALSLVDEMVQSANEALDTNPKDKTAKRETVANLAYIEKVMGFGVMNPFEYFQFGFDEETKEKISTLIEERNEAKKARDYERSDAIRNELAKLGVSLMDTAQGTFWERTN
jgi:cysteinyl-tRNA synthetase